MGLEYIQKDIPSDMVVVGGGGRRVHKLSTVCIFTNNHDELMVDSDIT